MINELKALFDYYEKEKGIDRGKMVEALSQALLAASKKSIGPARELRIDIDPDKGTIKAFAELLAVETVTNPWEEIPIAIARKLKEDVQVGDEIEIEVTPNNMGRIAAQTAKQTMLQRLRMEEKDNLYEEFKDRTGDVVSGVVRRFEKSDVVIDLGKFEGVITGKERVATEDYSVGDRMRFYVKAVEKDTGRAPKIMVSSTHQDLDLARRLIVCTIEEANNRYRNRNVANDVSFKVEKGEVLGFLGPKGAGKSTTMRLVTGYFRPTRGSVSLGGIDMLEEPEKAKQLRGYLPENAPISSEIAVLSFLGFCAELRGIHGADRTKAIDRVLAMCFLDKVRNQSVDTLSKGYRHRTCFAQSIIHDPEVLILDEPTDGLGPNQKHEVRGMTKGIRWSKLPLLTTNFGDFGRNSLGDKYSLFLESNRLRKAVDGRQAVDRERKKSDSWNSIALDIICESLGVEQVGHCSVWNKLQQYSGCISLEQITRLSEAVLALTEPRHSARVDVIRFELLKTAGLILNPAPNFLKNKGPETAQGVITVFVRAVDNWLSALRSKCLFAPDCDESHFILPLRLSLKCSGAHDKWSAVMCCHSSVNDPACSLWTNHSSLGQKNVLLELPSMENEPLWLFVCGLHEAFHVALSSINDLDLGFSSHSKSRLLRDRLEETSIHVLTMVAFASVESTSSAYCRLIARKFAASKVAQNATLPEFVTLFSELAIRLHVARRFSIAIHEGINIPTKPSNDFADFFSCIWMESIDHLPRSLAESLSTKSEKLVSSAAKDYASERFSEVAETIKSQILMRVLHCFYATLPCHQAPEIVGKTKCVTAQVFEQNRWVRQMIALCLQGASHQCTAVIHSAITGPKIDSECERNALVMLTCIVGQLLLSKATKHQQEASIHEKACWKVIAQIDEFFTHRQLLAFRRSNPRMNSESTLAAGIVIQTRSSPWLHQFVEQ